MIVHRGAGSVLAILRTMTDRPVLEARIDARRRLSETASTRSSTAFLATCVAEAEAAGAGRGALDRRRSRRLVAAGGKRLRPAFCYWGYRAAGGADGDADRAGVGRAGAAAHDGARARRPDGRRDGTPRRTDAAPAWMAASAAAATSSADPETVRDGRRDPRGRPGGGAGGSALAGERASPPTRLARRALDRTTDADRHGGGAVPRRDGQRRRTRPRRARSPRSRAAPTPWRDHCSSAPPSPTPSRRCGRCLRSLRRDRSARPSNSVTTCSMARPPDHARAQTVDDLVGRAVAALVDRGRSDPEARRRARRDGPIGRRSA